MLEIEGVDARHIHKLRDVLSVPVYHDADILHTAVPVTLRLWRKPVVLTIHGEYPIERNIWRHLYPASIKMADAVTIPSRFLRNRLGLDDAVVIPNAVFPERFKAIEQYEKAQVHIVTVTKFAFRDKAESLLNLLRIIENIKKASDRQIDYTVIGGGKYLEEVKKKVGEYNLEVRFTGFVDRPYSYFGGCDIFAYYSTHDNFPIAILEAMASGLPVITNEVGAVAEMIGHGKEGLIARDDREYGRYLERLIDDRTFRASLGRNARKKVMEQFNWRRIINQYIKLYECVR